MEVVLVWLILCSLGVGLSTVESWIAYKDYRSLKNSNQLLKAAKFHVENALAWLSEQLLLSMIGIAAFLSMLDSGPSRITFFSAILITVQAIRVWRILAWWLYRRSYDV